MGSTWKDLVLKAMREQQQPTTPYNKGNRLIETLKEHAERQRDEYGRFVANENPGE